MCGRFLIDGDTLHDLEAEAWIPTPVQEQLHLGMIYPSQTSLALVWEEGRLTGKAMKFGFFSETMKKRLINARAETILQKYMFRQAMRSARCLIPCTRFYEWTADKVRVSFFEKNHPILYLAGIYLEDQFIILTTDANSSMEPFHHRMPLILSRTQALEWVQDYSEAKNLLKTTPPLLQNDFYEQPSLF